MEEEDITILRARLRFELQQELLSWFQVRFWGAAVVIAVISFFGIRSIFQEALDDRLEESDRLVQVASVEAATATALANDAAARAARAANQVEEDIELLRVEIENLRELTKSQAEALEDFKNRAQNMDVTFQEIEVRIQNVRSSTQTLTTGSIDVVLRRIEALELSLSELAFATDTSGTFAASASDRELEQNTLSQNLQVVKQRSEYSVTPWLAHVEPDTRNTILEALADGQFPTTELQERDGFSFDYKTATGFFASGNQALERQAIHIFYSTDIADSVRPWISDLSSVLTQLTSFDVYSYVSTTLGNGVVLTFRN